MSEQQPSSPPGPPAPPSGAPLTPGPPPVVRLQTWVIIVLLLTLLASCGAAGRTVTIEDTGDGSVSVTELQDMCRLMGALAGKQGVDLDRVFSGGAGGGVCQDAARQAGSG